MELEIYTDFNRHGAEAVGEAREAEWVVGLKLIEGVGENDVRFHWGWGVEIEANTGWEKQTVWFVGGVECVEWVAGAYVGKTECYRWWEVGAEHGIDRNHGVAVAEWVTQIYADAKGAKYRIFVAEICWNVDRGEVVAR